MIARLLASLAALPLLAGLYGALLASGFIRLLLAPRGRRPSPQALEDLSATIAVLGSGASALERRREAVLAALGGEAARHEVRLVDCAGGSAAAKNAAARAASRPILVFVAEDAALERGFLGPLLEPFHDPLVFAAGARKTIARWAGAGLALGDAPPDEEIDARRRARPCFRVSTGAGAFRRDLFLRLGGLDASYRSAEFAEADLCFRAWRRGFASVFVPGSGLREPGGAAGEASRAEDATLWACSNLDGAAALLRSARGALGLALRDPGAVFRLLARVPRLLARRLRETGLAAVDDAAAWRRARAGFLRSEDVREAPLRLLLLTPSVPRQRAHAGTARVHRLLAGLKARGHRVDVIAVGDTPDPAARREAAEACHDLAVIDDPPGPARPLALRPRVEAETLAGAIRRALAAWDVRAHDAAVIEFTGMAGAVESLDVDPVIWTNHEVLARARRSDYEAEIGLRRRLRALVRWMLATSYEARLAGRFRRVICLTAEDARELRAVAPPTRIRLVPMGADPPPSPSRAARRAPPAGGTVLYLGAYTHAPNVDAAIWLARTIAPLLRRARPELKVLIVGTNPPPEVRALGELHPRNVVTGFVADLEPIYDEADVFVASIRRGGGMRGKVVEAWVRGVPVVATALASEGFAIEPGRNILVADSAEAIAAAVLRLLDTDELRWTMGEAGRATAISAHSWDSAVAQLESVLREAVAEAASLDGGRRAGG